MVRVCFWRQKYATINTKALFLWIRQKPAGRCTAMPNREGGYGGYQSSQPQQNRMPRKVNAPGSGKVRRGVDPRPWGTAPPAAAHPARRSSHRSRRRAAVQRNARRSSGSPCTGQHPPAAAVGLSCAAAQPGQRAASPPILQTAPAGPAGNPCGHSGGHSAVGRGDYPAAAKQQSCGKCAGWHRADRPPAAVAPCPMPTAMAPATAAQALTGEPLARCSRPKPILTPLPRRPRHGAGVWPGEHRLVFRCGIFG